MRGIIATYLSKDKQYYRSLRNILGFTPGNLALYKLAFKHRSTAHDIKSGIKKSNERLEFLGDAILGSVVAEVLFKRFPFRDEGFLTEMRSKIVNRSYLNKLSKKLGLDQFVEFDERMINLHKQTSLFGDAFEALIGAIYLDRGYNFTRKFLINRIINPHVDIDHLELTETNFKSRILEWCQREGKEIAFELLENASSENSRLFSIRITVDGKELGIGQDYNKKNAEKIAAEKACKALNI